MVIADRHPQKSPEESAARLERMLHTVDRETFVRETLIEDRAGCRTLRMLTADPSIDHFSALEIMKNSLAGDTPGPTWASI